MRFFLLLLILAGCTAVTPQKPEPDPMPYERMPRPSDASIKSLVEEMAGAYRWKSISTFAIVTDENFSPSRDGFLERIESRFHQNSFSRVDVAVSTVDFDASGKLAVARTQWVIDVNAQGEGTRHTGTTDLVFALRNGAWKLIRQDGQTLFGAP